MSRHRITALGLRELSAQAPEAQGFFPYKLPRAMLLLMALSKS